MSRRQEHNLRLAVPDTRRDKAGALRHTGKVPLEEEEDDPVEKAEWSSEGVNRNQREGNQLSVDAWGGDAWQVEGREDRGDNHAGTLDAPQWGIPDDRPAHHAYKGGDGMDAEYPGLDAAQMQDRDELYPPKNFAMVCKGVFRSAYPTKKNFDFLRKLKLKSVVYLCQEEYSPQVILVN